MKYRWTKKIRYMIQMPIEAMGIRKSLLVRVKNKRV